MSQTDPSITLKIRVLSATNLKGSKPNLSSFTRVQFADFDFKDVVQLN
jgi:hypothetical protein